MPGPDILTLETSADILQHKIISLDFETNNTLTPREGRISGLGVGCTNKCYYFDWNEDVKKLLINIVSDAERICVWHNFQFDSKWLIAEGIKWNCKMADTMVMWYLLDERRFGKYALKGPDGAAKIFYGLDLPGYSEAIQGNLFTQETFADYGRRDVQITKRLFDDKYLEIEEQGLKNIFWDFDCVVLAPTGQMEENGLYFNVEKLKEMAGADLEEMRVIDEEAVKDLGFRIDLASPGQVSDVIFDHLKLSPLDGEELGKNGKYSSDDDILDLMGVKYPNCNFLKIVRKHRGVAKNYSSYTGKYYELAKKGNGYVYGSFKTTRTLTGRYSGEFQQFPRVEDDEDPGIRKAICAPEGYLFIDCDLSQIELRLLAHVAIEQIMIDAFKEDKDIHQMYADIWKCERSIAKCLVGGTRVAVPGKGLIKIEDICDKREDDKFFDIKTPVLIGENEKHYAAQFYCNGEADTVKIITKHGRVIEGSGKHRILSDKNDGISFGNIKIGDRVKIEKTSCFASEYQKLRFNFWTSGKSDPREHSPLVVIDEKWGYFLGAVFGDGSVFSGRVHYCCHDSYNEVFTKYVDICKDLGFDCTFADTVTDTESGKSILHNCTVNNVALVRFLEQLGFCGHKGKEFRVPDVIFRSPKSVIAEYIKGVFETDGTISEKGGLSFTTKDFNFATDMIQLLSMFGIWASFERCWNKTYEKWYYRIHILVSGAKTFCDEIGLISDRKFGLLKEWANGKRRYIKKDPPEWVDTVEKIECGKGYLYDLFVPQFNRYVANGFINHNSINFMMVYGGHWFKLWHMINKARREKNKEEITQGEAKRLHGLYFDTNKKIAAWQKNGRVELHKTLVSKTLFGRRRRFLANELLDEKMEEHCWRQFLNHQIQGTAGDIIKRSIIRLDNRFHEIATKDPLYRDVKLCLQVHDELAYTAPKSIAKDAMMIVKYEMENSIKGLRVPIKANVGLAETWADAKA